MPNTAPIQENITAPGEMPAPQTPIINEPLPTPTPTPETSAPVEEKSFFQKLIANTQNLLNKTSEISSTIVNKTQNIAGSISNTTQNMANKIVEKTTAVSSTITNAPNMIAGQANTLIDKGIAMGGQLKDSVQNNAQNLTSNPLGAVQDIGSQIGQGAKNI
ncbi:MAG: hypothetical protein Q4B28_05895 [bacterium]|nr:hypothetical protein [bacterium]